eukprot:2661280-Amphidinium_carterae.1
MLYHDRSYEQICNAENLINNIRSEIDKGGTPRVNPPLKSVQSTILLVSSWKEGCHKQDDPKKDDPKKSDLKKDDPKQDDPKQDDPKKDDPNQNDPKKYDPKIHPQNV